jgi:hypothetical protein
MLPLYLQRYQWFRACFIPVKTTIMAIQYTTKVDGNTLFVSASGFDESLADVTEYGMGVLNACQQAGIHHVLCDETALEYRLGTFDNFRAGEFLSLNVPAISKIAIVCNPLFCSDASFFEDVVVNRGLRLRFFTDTKAAAGWLDESDTSLNIIPG